MYDAFAYVAKKWHKPDKLILLGDMLNNPERGDAGLGVWSANPLDWFENAKQLIQLFDAKEIDMIRGTGRHVMIGDKAPLPGEELLARDLDAKKLPGPGKYRSQIKFISNKWNFRMHFAHHVPSSQTEWYLPTPIAKEGIRLQLQQKRLGTGERDKIIQSFTEQIQRTGNVKRVTEYAIRQFANELLNAGDMDAIFRGHNHYWLRLDFKSQHLISCPCWQLPTEWMHKKGGEPLTDIGAVRFRLTPDEDDFEERFRIKPYIVPVVEGLTKQVRW
jgi:hypothetical protein